MRMITTSVTVYTFDELEPHARERAVQQVQDREATRDWDRDDLELIESTMVYTLAGKLNSPGVGHLRGRGLPGDRSGSRSSSGTWTGASCWRCRGGWTGSTHRGCRG